LGWGWRGGGAQQDRPGARHLLAGSHQAAALGRAEHGMLGVDRSRLGRTTLVCSENIRRGRTGDLKTADHQALATGPHSLAFALHTQRQNGGHGDGTAFVSDLPIGGQVVHKQSSRSYTAATAEHLDAAQHLETARDKDRTRSPAKPARRPGQSKLMHPGGRAPGRRRAAAPVGGAAGAGRRLSRRRRGRRRRAGLRGGCNDVHAHARVRPQRAQARARAGPAGAGRSMFS
jgi:hypothetical protein